MPKPGRWAALALAGALMACSGPETPDEERPDEAGAEAPTPSGRPAGGAVAPMDTGAWVIVPDEDSLPDPAGWTAGASRGGTADSIAILRTVRTARHDGYDRVVFEFDARVPGWRIEYVDSPQHECGSGEAVRVAGDGWLQVSFEPANAHTDEGRPTAQRRLVDPAGSNLRELRRICDFEAHVDYVIGVGSPNPYRAFMLRQPARLVVDIRN